MVRKRRPGYSGSEEGAGVIGMLEEIAQNFALMETNAKADETTQSDESAAALHN